MKKINSLEIKDKQAVLMKRCKDIVDTCKLEIREMTEDEEKEFNENKEEIKRLKDQLDELNQKLASYEDELPKNDDEEDTEKEKRNFTNSKKAMKNVSIVKEIRSAMENGT